MSKNTNNSPKHGESEILNTALENHIDESVLERLENLKAFIDPELFQAFHDKIVGIIQENPQAVAVVQNELDKTSLSLEQSAQNYTRTYQGILTQAMNDDFSQQDLRSRYGGKPANDAFY